MSELVVSTSVGPPAEASTTEIPSARDALAAIAGLAAFGLCVALGTPEVAMMPAIAALPLAAIVGSLVLTGPGLVAAYLLLRPATAAELPVAALGAGLSAAGTIAAGFAPIALFITATTGLWAPAVVLGSLAMAAAATAVTVRTAWDAADERAGFVALWTILAGLVAIRIAVGIWGAAMEAIR